MRNLSFPSIAFTALVLPLQLLAAEAEPARAFAAPGAAASLPTGSASGIGQVTVALLLVLAAVFAAGWLVRRLRGFAGGGAGAIDIVAQVALGARERAVVIRVGTTQLVLGVAPGRVNLLHVLPEGTELAPPPSAITGPQIQNFAALLKKSLGR